MGDRDQVAAPPPQASRRRLWHWGVLLATAYVSLEAAALVALRLREHAAAPLSTVRERARMVTAIGDERPAASGFWREAVHPYLGFVNGRASGDQDAAWAGMGVRVNSHGFVDDIEPVQKRAANRLVIGYFGGAVAEDLTELFRDHAKTLYGDVYCHLNEHGNELLAEAIGRAVLKSLAASSAHAIAHAATGTNATR